MSDIKQLEICSICNKPKPPADFSPFSFECDQGYTELLEDENGKLVRHPGFCDSKRIGLEWPPNVKACAAILATKNKI